MKLDWFAPTGDVAVAVFGMPKQAQLTLLLRLAKNFGRVRVVLDATALSNSVRLWWNDLEVVWGRKVRDAGIQPE